MAVYSNEETVITQDVATEVVTDPASNIDFNEMQLNGVLQNLEYYDEIELYFEYTTDEAFKTDPENFTGDLLETAPVIVTADTTFDEIIEGLDPQTIYYYRAVGRVESG